jgi:hypothetical protein
MTPMGDEEVEKWLAAVKPAAPTTPGEVTYLCRDVEASGLDLNRVRIWVEDKGGWGFFSGVRDPYFEVPDTKAPRHDPGAMTRAEYERALRARSPRTTD